MTLHGTRLTPDQAEARTRLLELHKQLHKNLAEMRGAELSHPGLEDLIGAYRQLIHAAADTACEVAIAMESAAIRSTHE